MEELLDNIINCPNIKKCLNGDINNPCYKIIHTQENKSVDTFQIPEPWNGNLKNAKLVFISSNPSINYEEEYPNYTWNREVIFDFFINRFNGKIKKWVKNNIYVLLKTGKYYDKHVRFWASIKEMAKEIYNTETIRCGEDFCTFEIVKCKSKKEAFPIY